jgi:S-DNA-T family DNA segregation ATPase FtsK/SpoIIIE
MPTPQKRPSAARVFLEHVTAFLRRRSAEIIGCVLLAVSVAVLLALVSWKVGDPSINHAIEAPLKNWLGFPGAVVADVTMQLLGVSALALLFPLAVWGLRLITLHKVARFLPRFAAALAATLGMATAASLLPRTDSWPLPTGFGGVVGDSLEAVILGALGGAGWVRALVLVAMLALAVVALQVATSEPRTIRDEAEAAALARRKAKERDEDGAQHDEEPGGLIMAVGAVVCGGIAATRAVTRGVTRFRQGLGRRIADGTMTMVDRATRDEGRFAMAGAPVPPPEKSRRVDPVFQRAAPAEAPRPPAERPVIAVRPQVRPEPAVAEITPPEPARPEEDVSAPTRPAERAAGYAAAVAALQSAARRRIGALMGTAAVPPPPVQVVTDSERPGHRAAVEALQTAARRRIEMRRIEPRLDDVMPARPVDQPRAPAETAAPARDGDSKDDWTPSRPDSVPASRQDQAPAAPVYSRVAAAPGPIRPGRREREEAQPDLLKAGADYELPPIALLAEPRRNAGVTISEDALEQNARLLEGVLEDFGVRGEIINVRPGPVVTLYELEPAPGTKSSRVIGLADDIARSMSAISARVAVVPGRNAIGIELPNQRRETVYFREIIGSQDFERSSLKLALALGKTIGGEPVVAELAKMPHLLVAGTTGSGKSVAINTMILSLLYRLTPEQCRLIMIDPKMLELSVYDGIPHLLSPVVTDPKKAIIALKWAVREMEDRYRKMSRLGVRNIDGFNQRVAEARASGETIMRPVQTGFDRETGEPITEEQAMDLATLPYIIVIIDEMADLMMVAGKDIEGAVQRLAQMARAAGIHVIMATQRPSVDVITGTIKANFPTRISFQVTSKIDSRTILGEMGAEQLLGQGDMLHMAGGGRISRVHGPFVSDEEVERVVQHLKRQGRPQYLDAITRDEDEAGEASAGAEDGAVFDKGEFGAEDGADVYEQAVRVVLRDRKASTSYIQRRLQIGYNRAASLMERMEREGVVGAANHAGKREILVEAEAETDSY